MNYELIETPSDDIVSIRLVNKSNYFRPSSTGKRTDLDRLFIKAKSEEYEDRNAGFINFKYFSSAAHTNKLKSIKNAYSEAIERLSVNIWWKYNRPAIKYIDEIDGQKLIKYFSIKCGYDIRVMQIHNICGDGFCCVAILYNKDLFPYYVMGSSYEYELDQAIIKSCHEALQSWAATLWLINNKHTDIPYWDYSQLRKRLSNIEKSENKFPKIERKDLTSQIVTIEDFDSFITYTEIDYEVVENLILSDENIATDSVPNF